MKKVGAWVLLALVLVASSVPAQQTEAPLPALTEPVNDFAGVIDAESRAEMDRVIRVLQAGTGDVIVVATVKDVEPYADIRDYAVRLFENQGRGIGERGKDNGLLVLLSTGTAGCGSRWATGSKGRSPTSSPASHATADHSRLP